MPCKRSRDNLYKMVVRSGDVEWFKSTESDDGRFSQLLSVYDRIAPVLKDGKRGRSKFSFATYKESYETTTEIIQDQVAEMMDKSEFMQHGMSKGWSKELTLAKWQHMVDNVSEMVVDYKDGEQ